MDKNQSEQYVQNNISQQSNPSKLQEARFRKAMQNRVQNLTLTNIIGLTSTSKHNMQFNPVTGDLYYVAGSTIIVYNIDQNIQKRYITSPNKKNIVAICFSKDGRYLAAGEGTCKGPEIIIWDLHALAAQPDNEKPMKQLKGHKIGLKMLFFSPNLKYLLSIGDEHDKGLFVWDWNNEERITLNKMSKVPHSACFSDDGSKFATCGEKHIKLWQFQPNGDIIKTPVKEKENAYIIEGKSINLGTKFQDKILTDCEFDKQSKQLYVSTSTGQLCIVDENRILSKWMDLKVFRIFNISLSHEYVICSCSDSFIRIFKTLSLDHVVTFPKIPPLLNYNIEKGVTKIKPPSSKAEYADVIGLTYDENKGRISAIYSDRSLFIWDITQLDKITMKRSFLNHSGAINDLQILSNPSSSEVTFFMTTSADKTARIWHEISDESGKQQDNQNLGLRRNAYSKNLSRIIYLTSEVDTFKYQEQVLPLSEEEGMKQEIPHKKYPTCIKSTIDGSQIILADNTGLLTIMNVSNLEVECTIQAHDKEISCIDIVETPYHRLLATGGRDRQIKIFDLNNNYKQFLTLDDHSSSIVGLKFAVSQDHSTIYLVTAANDKQIIFREFKNYNFIPIHREVDKNHKINSLDLSSDHQTLFVGFDKKINTYSVTTGKLIKSTETKEDEKVGKTLFDNLSILTDVSSSYVAAFNQDKVIRIRECSTMSVVSKAYCGDNVTGMGFTMNNSHLITSSSEGIIYIWKISSDLKLNIEKKRQSLGIIAKKLQDLFNKDGQNLINTKDWNLGSFWIEEEMRQHLLQQQKLNQNVPSLQKDESTDPILANLKPADLMQNTNLPNWAKSNNNNINIKANNQQQVDKQKIQDEDHLLNDFKDRINGDKKQQNPFEEKKQQQQQYQKSNNFISDSEIIGDSINGRYNSYFQGSSVVAAVQNKMINQNAFGLDSINERDDNDEDIFSKSKKTSSFMGFRNQSAQNINEKDNNDNSNNNGNKNQQNESPIYIDDNKVIGLQLKDNDESDDFQYNSDHISQFLKQDMTIPVSGTQANLYNKLTTTTTPDNNNNKYDSQQKVKQNEIEVEDIYNQENRKNTPNTNSSKSNKDNNDIQYKKDNGMLSLFSVDQIQGQLQKVEHNIKQAENNFKFKNEQMNIFQSSQQPSVPIRQQPLTRFSQNNIMSSINMNDAHQIIEQQDNQEQNDGLIMIDDAEDFDDEPQIKQISRQQPPHQKHETFSINNKDNQSHDLVKAQLHSKKELHDTPTSQGDDQDVIQVKDKHNPLRGSYKGQHDINNNKDKYDSNKLSFKGNDHLKKESPTHLLKQQKDEEETIQEEIMNNQSTESEGFISLHQQQVKHKKGWGIVDNKKAKETEKIFTESKIKSIMGEAQNQNYIQKKNMQLLEEVNDEFDESYAISNTKEYQSYQNQIDNSFRVILEHLNQIEDLVENKLDHEPVSIRKKVFEKIQLKSNKVKTSLQNINYKHQQLTSSSATNLFNHSSMESDFVNKDLLENYSKLLLEAVLKRK